MDANWKKNTADEAKPVMESLRQKVTKKKNQMTAQTGEIWLICTVGLISW